MKKLLCLLTLVLFSAYLLHAQVAPPQAFSFKATIISKSGAIIASRTVSLRISILKNNTEGIAVYAEIFYPKTNEYGQVDLLIGKGNPLIGNFASIEWSNDNYFLKTEVDVKGGTDFLMMSTVQLLSVPYSLLSDKSNHAFSADEKDPVFSAHPSSNISAGDISNWNEAAGWGDHSLAGYAPFDSVYTKSDFLISGRSEISWNNLAEHPAKNITGEDITNWNAAFSWGDHSQAGYAISDSVYTKSDLKTEGRSEVNWNNLGNKPEFAPVATTGKYNDLNNLPVIPDNLNQLTPDAGKRTVTNVARPVNPSDAATKAYVDGLIERITALEKVAGIVHIERDSVQDYQGNTYKTVRIGNQWWMAENLKSTRYSNGEPVNRVVDNAAWSNLNTGGAYCFYNNDSTTYKDTYGILYNWYAVTDSRNICPAGWHVPSDGEWTTLSAFAGGDILAGGKLKEKDLVHWIIQNAGATDDFGFTGLPAGTRNPNGTYSGIGTMGHFWTITEVDVPSALFRRMTNTTTALSLSRTTKTLGTSVRCIKGESAPSAFAVVTTDSVTNITATSAFSGGNVLSDSGDKVTARGVCWSSGPNPLVIGAKTTDGADTGRFTSNITNLTPGRKFYLRAYATNSAGTAYGNEISFTASPGLASLTSFDASSVTTTSAVCSGAVTYDGGAPVTSKGICWGELSLPTIENDTTNEGPGTGAFVSNLTELEPGRNYTFRPYAINSTGVAYGQARVFRTLDPPISVNTDTIKLVTANSAIIGGAYTGPQGVEYGVCWSVSPNPTIENNKVPANSEAGSYESRMTGLSPNTTYYARTYAITSSGPVYGNEVVITTVIPTLPAPYFAPNDTIRSTTAWLLGKFEIKGGYSLTETGINWSTSPDSLTSKLTTPAYGNEHWFCLSGLNPNTKYYARLYAINELGTGYGPVMSFITNPAGIIIPVFTGNPSIINSSTASIEGYVRNDGGADITDRGICWGTASSPGLLDNKISNGSDTGKYVCTITGLVPGNTYYARAFAVNVFDTSYANEVSFVMVNGQTETVTDAEGNTYNTVTIGSQTWLKENLKTTKYANGDPIPNITGSEWIAQTSGAYCWYNNDIINKTTYGALYNWYAVADPRNICPAGWHEPTNGEWTVLVMQLGGESVAGGKLKEAGLIHWLTPNIGANESGFTALPGGMRDLTANFSPAGRIGNLWSATQCDSSYAFAIALSNSGPYSSVIRFPKAIGMAVRCIKGEATPVNLPEVTTSAVTNITSSGATSGGTVLSDGGEPVVARGVCFNTLPGPTISNSKTLIGSGTGEFTSTLSNLQSGRTFYARAYATNAAGTAYGNEISFTTPQGLASVGSITVSGVTSNSASFQSLVGYDGGSPVTERGFCWSTDNQPTTADSKSVNGSGTGTFSTDIDSLMPMTTYYVRAYAINELGTAYGPVRTMQTLAPPQQSIVIASNFIAPITSTSVQAGGNINSSTYPIVERGVCWNTSPNPTVLNNKVISSTADTGRYTVEITGLIQGTRYFVRAYAVNTNETVYGNEVSFVMSYTPPEIDTLYMSTLQVSSIGATTAVSGGNITDANGHDIFERGVCWSTSIHPVYSQSSVVSAGSGTGTYSCSIMRLMPGTQYFVRAYARTSRGTFYGNDLTFTTASGPLTVPNINTILSQVSDSAAISGRVFDSEGHLISERGLCWDTSPDPLITANKMIMGSDTGWYNYTLKGITPGVRYYARSYAIKSGQVLYGNAVCFITGENPSSTPIIFTNYVVPSSSAVTVTSQIIKSALPLTEAGVCWNDSANPSTTDNKLSVAPALGSFTVDIPGLIPGKTYTVRSYAVNSLGTGYGNILVFTVPPAN